MDLAEYMQKARQLEEREKSVQLAFLANFTVNGLPEVLKLRCDGLGATAHCYQAPYNQYMQEVLDPNSGLYQNNPQMIFLLLDTEVFLRNEITTNFYNHGSESEDSKLLLESYKEQLRRIFETLSEKTKAKIVVSSLRRNQFSPQGIAEKHGLRKFISKINAFLEEYSENNSQVLVFDTNLFFAKHGEAALVDPNMFYLADMKYSPQGIVLLGEALTSYLYPLLSKTKKCLVLDLDNTLWGGVIGEDGMEGIRLGPEKEGLPFMHFQQGIKQFFEQGTILAINSKNNEEDAMEVIRSHPHMVLREEHFAARRINWQDKASNLKEIASELNIGTDSLIFLDDDDSNCALVREMLPEVEVIQIPKNSALIPNVLENIQSLNKFSITNDDRRKGEMYVEQAKRNVAQSQAGDLNAFLESLDIKIQVEEGSNIARVAQLTQKTNQFNLTTKRYQEEDIKNFSSSNEFLVKSIIVQDKFGDYGTTGVIIVRRAENTWNIDSFLLSCRVLGKRVEFGLMEHIKSLAKASGVQSITANFVPTAKNAPCKDFLPSCGFTQKDGAYVLDLQDAESLEYPGEVISCKA